MAEQRSNSFDLAKLINILVSQKAISSDEGKALKKGFEQARNAAFDDFLLGQGLIDKEDLLNALSVYYEVPAFDVVGYFFDHELLLKFPKDVLLRNEFIPLETDEVILIVVAANPADENLLSIIGKFVSYDVQFRVGITRDITDAVEEFYDKALTVVGDQDVIEREREHAIEFLEHEKTTVEQEELDRPDRG